MNLQIYHENNNEIQENEKKNVVCQSHMCRRKILISKIMAKSVDGRKEIL